MTAVQQCIQLSIRFKKDLLEQEMREIKLWQVIEWPSFNNGWVKWKPSMLGKIKQALILLIVAPVLMVLSLVMSCIESYDKWQRMKNLERNKRELETLPPFYQGSQEKSIYAFWKSYGLDKRYGIDQQIHLMEEWIKLLYGPDMLKRHNLKSMADKIRKMQFEANLPYYAGDGTSPHFHFVPVADCLAMDISGELPPYEGCN